MAMKNRHKWLAKRLESAFDVPASEALELIRSNAVRVNEFLTTTDDRLFIFHQPAMKQLAVSRSASTISLVFQLQAPSSSPPALRRLRLTAAVVHQNKPMPCILLRLLTSASDDSRL
jgi:hypothetical protein